jgi:hypothetical protein
MVCLIELSLSQFAVALTVIALLATAAGFAWYNFRAQKLRVGADAIKDWRDVADAQNKKIVILEEGLQQCREEHEKGKQQVNVLTQTILRFLARERSYRLTINRLEVRAGLATTDWDDITDAPESFDFG